MSEMFSTSKVSLGRFPKLTDPSDGAGIELPGFKLYHSYRVGKDRVNSLCNKLYEHVFSQITAGSLGEARARLIKYVDSDGEQTRIEGDYRYERTYIVISRDTPRSTRATAFIRFHSFGDHLYLGLDSYALGGVRWSTVIKRIFVTIVLYILCNRLVNTVRSATAFGAFGSSGQSDPSFFLWLIFFAFLTYFWWELIRRLLQNEGKPIFSLRQAFVKPADSGTFNSDDVVMFLKPTLHTAVLAVREVLADENLPVETLDDFAKNINNINNISIETGGGLLQMFGSAIGIGVKMD